MAASPFFDPINAMWPDLASGRAFVSPPRNGVDRRTGKVLSGWAHVEQSMEVIFETRFHERVLRRWVGSFVPHILGESVVSRVVTRFFFAISSAIDLWEPDYRIKQVYFMGNALRSWAPTDTLDAANLLRLGDAIFRTEGIYFPRGHLGDFTPDATRTAGLIGNGSNLWDVVPIGNT